jgi:hypothetical protein
MEGLEQGEIIAYRRNEELGNKDLLVPMWAMPISGERKWEDTTQ